MSSASRAALAADAWLALTARESGSSAPFDRRSVAACCPRSLPPPFLQASLSLPGSPFDKRRSSQYSVAWARNDHRHSDRLPLVLQDVDAHAQDMPFADESAVATPLSEESGAILAPSLSAAHSRHSSYTSHCSRLSYTSHGDVCVSRGGDGGGGGVNGNAPVHWTHDKVRGCLHEVRVSCLFLTRVSRVSSSADLLFPGEAAAAEHLSLH